MRSKHIIVQDYHFNIARNISLDSTISSVHITIVALHNRQQQPLLQVYNVLDISLLITRIFKSCARCPT